ncbi:hydrolase [Neobacillus kokaensis]|uniref:Hydrolase n=1 Tax=Neobacillus kokaensis TaxID=2759023 RepID=A0ABQ3N323_9BACI|nr:hydrolase [Neobacillus kokaensis]GHH98491.1 hydrolase [Neobacillus kokaensis]
MDSRVFQVDTQWNIIYYPARPNGFGVLIIGDERHFVEENKCYWTQNEGKHAILNELKEKGYTIFSSNLYGRHWGSENAVELAQRVYERIIRSEILNTKIHILAEGMGALVAVELMEKMKDMIRSIILLNPILSLKLHLEQEKEHKFFYKKLMRELTTAYEMDQNELEEKIVSIDDQIHLDGKVPVKIIHVLSGGRSYNQSKQYKKILAASTIIPTFIVPEKKLQIGKICINFFQHFELEL